MSKVIVWACSFCGQTQHEVETLIAGPRDLAICDECVEVCVAVLKKGQPTTESQRATES